MRLFPGLTLLVLCCGTCAAQTVVPLSIEDDDYILTLRVADVHLKAVLDTSGGYGIAIAPEALTRIKVRYNGDTVERIGMGGEKFRGRDFVIPSLELGDTVFLNVDGFERRHGGGDGDVPYDVVIGNLFLEHYTVVVDYPRQRLELHPSGHGAAVCGPPSGGLMPTVNHIVFSTVRTDSGAMNLRWRSRSTYSVVLKAVAYLRGLTVKDGFYTTKRFAFGNFNTGPVDMAEFDVSGIPDLDGLIGSDFFERFRVCFDFAEHTVSVRPN